MISDSVYWKSSLLKQAKILQKYGLQKKWQPISYVKLEQTIMVGCYSVRKLLEAKTKISTEYLNNKIQIISHRCIKPPVTINNWHRVEVLYDLDKKRTVNKSIKDICNQFVHSYVFMPAFFDCSNLQGFFVSSDYDRNKVLYYVTLGQATDIFLKIGDDYPDRVSLTFDEGNNDYVVHTENTGLSNNA